MQFKLKLLSKILIFVLISILIGGLLQNILLLKFGYPNGILYENNDKVLPGFYREQKGKIDVVTLGASIMSYGFSPMELYEAYGIYSYNLGSSAQSLPLSYYVLQDAFKYQSPKLILLDVSSLYYPESDSYNNTNWRYVLNNMRLGKTKIQAAIELSKNNEQTNLLNTIFPIVRYHERWKEITKQDFEDFNNKTYYSKGYNLMTFSQSGWSQDSLAEEAKAISSDYGSIAEYYENGEFYNDFGDQPLYNALINDFALLWLKKIDLLCKANNAKLLLLKIPSYGSMIYNNPWTTQKSEQVKELAKQNGYDFLDLMYDSDTGLDWSKDSIDSGSHLNLLGAEKVSNIIGKYIIENYELSLKSDLKDETWEHELDLYNQLKKVAKLQLECNLPNYINMLRENFNDKTIFIMTASDMTAGLTENDKVALKELGLYTDFTNAYRKSYVAVINNGHSIYECLSNRVISYEGKTMNSGRKYILESAGWYLRNRAGLYFDGNKVNCAIGNPGINIVVYDDNLNMILDRVCFYTDVTNYGATRNNHYSWKDFREYECYMMDTID